MIPSFNEDGTLPPGVHWATWAEIVERFGFNAHRRILLEGLSQAIDSLRILGCPTLYLDGSFVTAKPLPNDFDACWVRDGVDAEMLDRELLDGTQSGRAAQKARYGGELFPMRRSDEQMPKSWLSFFQRSRDGSTKGIIAIDLRALS